MGEILLIKGGSSKIVLNAVVCSSVEMDQPGIPWMNIEGANSREISMDPSFSRDMNPLIRNPSSSLMSLQSPPFSLSPNSSSGLQVPFPFPLLRKISSFDGYSSHDQPPPGFYLPSDYHFAQASDSSQLTKIALSSYPHLQLDRQNSISLKQERELSGKRSQPSSNSSLPASDAKIARQTSDTSTPLSIPLSHDNNSVIANSINPTLSPTATTSPTSPTSPVIMMNVGNPNQPFQQSRNSQQGQENENSMQSVLPSVYYMMIPPSMYSSSPLQGDGMVEQVVRTNPSINFDKKGEGRGKGRGRGREEEGEGEKELSGTCRLLTARVNGKDYQSEM